ncbi:universal stress protein [Streptomyces sp. NPDC050516]|uniref:universal stress protein n=1 Tax=Streptomyces sp. NPDC050516 TaxID=3365621 RepID=UPI0037BAE366
MIRPVTAGVDGSPESLAAVDWAADEAQRRHLPLHLVHAWQWKPPPSASTSVNEADRRWVGRVLREAVGRVSSRHPGLHLTHEQVAGEPLTALLAAAGWTELLVLGSRGLGSFAGFLLGSVSQGIIARTHRPVVLVRAERQSQDDSLGGTEGQSRPGNVVVGLDLGHPCDELIAFAFEAARVRKAELHVVHAYRSPAAYGFALPQDRAQSDPERMREKARVLMELLHPWRAKWPEVTVTEIVAPGIAAERLLRATSGAGLLIVGRRPYSASLGLHTGPVTHAVLHHAGCPVAVVPGR